MHTESVLRATESTLRDVREIVCLEGVTCALFFHDHVSKSQLGPCHPIPKFLLLVTSSTAGPPNCPLASKTRWPAHARQKPSPGNQHWMRGKTAGAVFPNRSNDISLWLAPSSTNASPACPRIGFPEIRQRILQSTKPAFMLTRNLKS